MHKKTTAKDINHKNHIVKHLHRNCFKHYIYKLLTSSVKKIAELASWQSPY
ncbi:hypothetical protein GCHA_1010 [Paraglaciecola chathamensis S18K6]|uniref:Transposase n=1 Tax=Paraglaciecola chathamensis S18K6 TaxID=1127672 RepID=A0AAV3UV07_9ALTE|nr:hypothetical protein GCHA_1010 [Paraglaciecola chathamensis S18K6]